MWIFCVLLMVTVVESRNTMFELDTRLNDKDLFEDLVLGPPATFRRPDECAQQCVKNPQCSMFSFNHGAETCQLYGDVVYPTVPLTALNTKPGARYYAYRTGWCPQKDQFLMFRAVDLCVRLSRSEHKYKRARRFCWNMGLNTRLIVLEDEEKSQAVTNLLAKFGLNTTRFTVGLTNNSTEFVWSDGKKMIRDWWYPGQPNILLGDEACVFQYDGKLYDWTCNRLARFICEIPY